MNKDISWLSPNVFNILNACIVYERMVLYSNASKQCVILTTTFYIRNPSENHYNITTVCVAYRGQRMLCFRFFILALMALLTHGVQ